MTGMCVFQGDAENPEIVYGSPVDYYAASLLAYGVTVALFHRERTGVGQFVGISLLRSALAMQSARFIYAQGEPLEVGRDMRSGGITGIHPTREGWLYISANTPHFWSSLCELVGLPELAGNPDFDSVRKRAAKADELVPKLRKALLARSAREWEELFGEKVPCCAVRRIEEMFDHPQVSAEGLVARFEHPKLRCYQGLTQPVQLSEYPGSAPFAAPTFGQHTKEVLSNAGYSDEEISRLRKSGAIPGET
jgi:formyl-CoA transferase